MCWSIWAAVERARTLFINHEKIKIRKKWFTNNQNRHLFFLLARAFYDWKYFFIPCWLLAPACILFAIEIFRFEIVEREREKKNRRKSNTLHFILNKWGIKWRIISEATDEWAKITPKLLSPFGKKKWKKEIRSRQFTALACSSHQGARSSKNSKVK